MPTQPTVVDPVCGMAIDPAHAASTIERDGTVFCFCSTHCANSFEEDRVKSGPPPEDPGGVCRAMAGHPPNPVVSAHWSRLDTLGTTGRAHRRGLPAVDSGVAQHQDSDRKLRSVAGNVGSRDGRVAQRFARASPAPKGTSG